MKNIFKDLKSKDHKRYLGGLDVFRYIGPGLLVTVGFIDPGNWASNFAAGSEFGYSLLWVVTTQCCSLGNRDRALPFGGGNAVYAQMGIASHTGDGRTCFHLYITGRDSGRGHSTGNVARHSYCLGGRSDYRFCFHHAFYKFI